MSSFCTRLLLERLILLALLIVPIIGSSASETKPKQAVDGKSSVWVVEKDGRKMYLAGTIHLLREEDYPLPNVFEQAYQDCGKVVFELPPGSSGDGEIVVHMRKMGSYEPGDDLSKHVSAETFALVEAWAGRKDIPMAALKRLKPWFLALTIAATEYQALGAASERGVDTWFEERAKNDGKRGEGLETVEFQLTMFASLRDELQEELLRQTFSEVESLSKDFTELLEAWRAGDGPRLHKFLFRDAEKYPELMDDFLIKRNKTWIPALMKLLESGETAMILVGAGHLVGGGGVIELLEEQGCKVRQL